MRPTSVSLRYAITTMTLIMLGLVFFQFQNCSGEPGSPLSLHGKSNASESGDLNLSYSSTSINVYINQSFFTVTGLCRVGQNSSNKITWQLKRNSEILASGSNGFCLTNHFTFQVSVSGLHFESNNYSVASTLVTGNGSSFGPIEIPVIFHNDSPPNPIPIPKPQPNPQPNPPPPPPIPTPNPLPPPNTCTPNCSEDKLAQKNYCEDVPNGCGGNCSKKGSIGPTCPPQNSFCGPAKDQCGNGCPEGYSCDEPDRDPRHRDS